MDDPQTGVALQAGVMTPARWPPGRLSQIATGSVESQAGGAFDASNMEGTVSFGLVSIPVNLYVATESKNIAFRQVHGVDGGRIQDKRICLVDGKEVPYTEVAKGYEMPGGAMVILTDDDLASLPVASSKSIEVREFVPLESIDPIYFDRSYYLEPQRDAVKPYLLWPRGDRQGRAAAARGSFRAARLRGRDPAEHDPVAR